MSVQLSFADGKSLSFHETSATDIGTYTGSFVTQHCLRQRASGNNDYRDAFVVFFRPDSNFLRDEVIVEFGTEYNFLTSPPTVPTGVKPQQLPAYTAIISGGTLTSPATLNVPQHWWQARWRWQSAPRPVIRTLADLSTLKAILPMDPTLAQGGHPPTTGWSGPMSAGPVYYGMPDTGDRADIGPMPDWVAMYLIGNANYEAAMRAGAEATGTMHFWVRDAATDALVDLKQHSYISFKDGKGGFPYQVPLATPPAAHTTNYFILNEAHMPGAAFVPWMLTDDPYFLEGAMATAQYGIMESNFYPLNEKLPTMASITQPRAFAWNLRDLMQLAAFAPETAPAWLSPRSYWKSLLPDSLTFAMKYVNANVSPCTTVFKLITLTNFMMQFHQDFIIAILCWAHWNGVIGSDWQPIINYAIVPRMNMSDPANTAGWDWRDQCPYYVPTVNARLGLNWVIAPNARYDIAFSTNTPTTWAELRSLYVEIAMAGKIADEKSYTDPATWPADDLNLRHQAYFPQTRWCLAAMSLDGISGAKTRHDWLKARMDRQLAIQTRAAKWAVPAV